MLILAAGTMEGRGESPAGRGADNAALFRETFLVLQVHEGWDGMLPRGEENVGGQFYVRNHVERWSGRERRTRRAGVGGDA